MDRTGKITVTLITILWCCLKYNTIEATCKSRNVEFILYSAESPEGPIRIQSRKLFCHQSYRIDQYTEVFFIIPGWLHTTKENYVTDIRKLLFNRKNKKTVVIEVNWSYYAKKDYDVAKSYNAFVANATSDVLSCLIEDYKFPHANIEIVCHCMGCHIAGLAGKTIRTRTGQGIGKITALDPSGPLYFNADQSQRLEPNDANMVFVIHTDAFMFGYGDRCGTVDVYPNGGKHPQPGCPEEHAIVQHDMCSHQRSVMFYIESLNHSKFFGIQCPTYGAYQSGLCSSNRRVNFAKVLKPEYEGIYFLKTNSKKPFLCKLRK